MTRNTWISKLSAGGGPKYLALVAVIEQGIKSGEIRPGERLPTHRELSQRFGMTIATVTKAMAVAARKGLVTTQVGNGTFASESPASGSSVVTLDLSLNILPEEVVHEQLAALLQGVSHSQLVHGMFGYGSYVPSPAHARDAVAWMNGFGAAAQPGEILLTMGAHQGLMAAFHALLSPGNPVLCEALTYTGIRRIAHYRQTPLVGVTCDESGMIPDALEAQFVRTGAKAVIVTSALHNPTTASLPAGRREAIAQLCRKYDAYLVEDGINMPLVGEAIPTVSAYAPERSIFLTSYSKCISSGFRLGYAIVPAVLRSSFLEALVSTLWIGPRLYVSLAERMLAEGLVEHIAATHRDEARARYDLAVGILQGIRSVAVPGYHVWVETEALQSGEDFALAALRQGVRISPAAHFAAAPETAPSTASYRVSLGAVRDRTELERALRILANLANHQSPTVSTLI